MWLDGFEAVTFDQSLGFPYRSPIRGVVWHTTEGWLAEHAFDVYAAAIKGACPHVTAEYAGAINVRAFREVTRRRFQHVDTWQASYAVQRGDKTHVCHVETNASGIIQIERVGFAADDVALDELRWLGEEVLAPILRAHPSIPPWVYHGPRMTEDEWQAWPGGQARHRDVPCQPDGHTDPGDLDLDVILHFALELLNPPPHPQEEADMILLRVVDDPVYPLDPAGGVFLELSGNGIAWVATGDLPPVYAAGGVRTVDVTVGQVGNFLRTKPGNGPPPSTANPPSVIHW